MNITDCIPNNLEYLKIQNSHILGQWVDLKKTVLYVAKNLQVL